jgi:hypothetical protein
MCLLLFLLGISCTTKGEKSVYGKELTMEEVQLLQKKQLKEGQLVVIEGYIGLCKMLNRVSIDDDTIFDIYMDEACKGKLVGRVRLPVPNISFKRLIGEEPRNYVRYNHEKTVTNETLEVVTDNYAEVHNQKLKFSGNIVYNKNEWYLKNVTVHL